MRPLMSPSAIFSSTLKGVPPAGTALDAPRALIAISKLQMPFI